MTSTSDRRLDLVVYGATSFVGQILCRHLMGRHGVDGDLRWALAGRSKAKLDRVAADTGADVERIVADAGDRDALADLVGSTRVVVSTVGPYALFGSLLVELAAGAGTDYCDLTGETQWIREMIDAHHETAVESGARIVHSCGFDSIPSDLGVWFTQAEAVERLGSPCSSISMRVKAMKGGASGGTIASMMNVVEEAVRDADLRRLLADPMALTPDGPGSGPPQPEVTRPTRDEVSGAWVVPFVMAGINTRVVHRSHGLQGHPWGADFTYDEAMMTGTGPGGALKATAVTGGIGGFMALSAVGPTRSVLKRFLPKAGEGPSAAAQEAGFFDLRFYGTTSSGAKLTTSVTGDRDPGYGCTAKMLGESAICLLELGDDVGGGVLTPSTALGASLVERLEEHAGMTFSVIE